MKQTKVCTACKETKPLSEFYADRRMSDGHASRCKSCQRQTMRERKAQNKEAQRRYREQNREALRAYNRQYFQEHKEARAEAQRQYRARRKAEAE